MSEWSVLCIPTRLLGRGDREQETRFFLIYRYGETILLSHWKYAACVAYSPWNKVQRSARVQRVVRCIRQSTRQRSRLRDRRCRRGWSTQRSDRVVDLFLLTLCDYHSCRIKAAWRPTPYWGHWLACRGSVCVRSRIGTPSLRIWDTPGSRTPGRNAATICLWDAALSAAAPTNGNVPSNLSGTPGRNYNPPRRTTRRSSPLSPEPPGSPPASRRRSNGIDDCAARVRSINHVLWINELIYTSNFSLLEINIIQINTKLIIHLIYIDRINL